MNVVQPCKPAPVSWQQSSGIHLAFAVHAVRVRMETSQRHGQLAWDECSRLCMRHGRAAAAAVARAAFEASRAALAVRRPAVLAPRPPCPGRAAGASSWAWRPFRRGMSPRSRRGRPPWLIPCCSSSKACRRRVRGAQGAAGTCAWWLAANLPALEACSGPAGGLHAVGDRGRHLGAEERVQAAAGAAARQGACRTNARVWPARVDGTWRMQAQMLVLSL